MPASENFKIETPGFIGLETILIFLLILPLMNSFPGFFYPREATAFDLLPDSVKSILGSPTNALVNNPIELCVISGVTLLVIGLVGFDLMRSRPPWWNSLRWIVLGLLVFVLVLLPIGWEMYARTMTKPYLHAHDGGVLQTEEAIKKLLLGKNPYTETYHDTPMFGYARRNPDDPPLHHMPYLPWIMVSSLPIYLIFNELFGWFDERVIYIFYYLIALLSLTALAGASQRKRLLVICFAFNPFLVPYFIQGRNDIVPLTLVILGLKSLLKQHPAAAGLWFGLGCASKQYVWLMFPFFLMVLFDRHRRWPQMIGKNVKILSVVAICVTAMLIGPFVMWDYKAFKDDLFDFNSGRAEISYALGGTPGYGIANLILYKGWVASRNDYFPFWPATVIFALPITLLVVQRTWNSPSLRMALQSAGISLLALAYVARLFHDNHFGFIVALFIIAGFGDRLDGAEWNPRNQIQTDLQENRLNETNPSVS